MILAAIQSSIMMFVSLCAVLLLHRQSAATRHAVLAAGLIASLIVPLVGGLLPEVPVEFLNPFVVPETWSANPFVVTEPEPAPASEAIPQAEANMRVAASISVRRSEAQPLFWIWLGGMSLGGIVILTGFVRVACFAFWSKPLVRDEWMKGLQETSAILRIRRRVRVLEGERAVLGTWGVLKPKILLPRDAGAWPAERIRVVLAHELAHVLRFDWGVQLLAEIARAVYWFNPLFWIACRLLKLESERACDDVVLSVGVEGKDYAAHLLALARMLRNQNRAWSPMLAMAGRQNLERRFIAMLNPSLDRRSVGRSALIAILAMVMCLGLPVATMRALVAAPALPAPPRPAPPPPLSAPPVAVRVLPKPVRRQGLADGSLMGTVSDPTGALVPGVIVTVTDQQKRVESQLATDEAGRFEFRALTPGFYSLAAQLPGFKNVRIDRIEIKSSQASRQNVILSIGNIAERVKVSAVGQPKPASVGGVPRRLRIGGNVQAANLISQVKPVYPESARTAGIEGTVHLQAIIGVDGALTGLRVVGANDRDLAAAALEAVRQWRYRPTLLNGEPAEVVTDIDVEFTLSQ